MNFNQAGAGESQLWPSHAQEKKCGQHVSIEA